MKTLFKPEQFTPTQWDTAEQKAKFANHFVRLVESDFDHNLFYRWFYKRLSMTFGHIAHYDEDGFWATFFTDTASKVRFLECTRNGGGYGDPGFTYSDVEHVLKVWLENNGWIGKYKAQLEIENEAIERAELARLQAKYQTAGKEG